MVYTLDALSVKDPLEPVIEGIQLAVVALAALVFLGRLLPSL